MKFYFPPRNQNYSFLQTNRSDDLGSLWSTMNVDLQSNLGVVRVAPRLKVNTSTADDADLGLPVAFENIDSTFWAICGTRVFKNTSFPNAAFTEDASTGAATDYGAGSDLEIFNSLLWASSTTTLYSKAMNGSGTGAWTSRRSFASGGASHQLVNFVKFNRLYFQDATGVVLSIDTSNVVATSGDYTLTINSNQAVACMKATSDYIWIGVSAASSTDPQPARILQWDGISAQITNEYLLKSRIVNSITIDPTTGVPFVMDGNGILNKFTGYSFEEEGRLPFVNYPPSTSFVQRNGMIPTKDNTILVLVNNFAGNNAATINTSTTYENIPAGIWEWSQDFGFTHKYAFTYNPAANATITDFGQNRISVAGALFKANASSQDITTSNGSILAGCTYFTDATTTTSAIFIDDFNNTVQKKGYIVTTWFNSDDVVDQFQRIWAIFRRLLNSTDSIVFKYRLNEEAPDYGTITWVNTTSFTVLNSDVVVSNYWTSGTGGEVEIMQGTGSGSCAHITNAVNNAGTWTVTIDTVITGVTTGTAKARFQNWIKVFPEITGQINSYQQMKIAGNSLVEKTSNTRCQVKCCMTFTGDDELQKFIVVSNEEITSQP